MIESVYEGMQADAKEQANRYVLVLVRTFAECIR